MQRRRRRSTGLRRGLLFFLLAAALSSPAPPAAGSGPVAVDDAVPATLGPMTILIDVLANDSHPSGAAMLVTSVSSITPPAQGEVRINRDGSLTLDLDDPGGLSEISFTYTVTDSLGGTAVAAVTVGSGGGGGSPQAEDDEYTIQLGGTENLMVLDNDGGADLAIIGVSPPGAATIGPGGQYLIYTADILGEDEFDYTIQSGGAGPTSTATVMVTVTSQPTGNEAPMGEVGEIPSLTHQPQWVSLSRTYQRPVVIVQPPTSLGADASAVRVLAVEEDRFQVRLQEAFPGDDVHCPGGTNPCLGESVSYLVVEAGRWDLGGGTVLEADTLVTDWTLGASTGTPPQVSFSEPMPVSPVVLTQVQSEDDPAWVTTRQGSVGAAAFDVMLQEEPPFTDGHGAETVGWVALTPGTGTTGGLPFAAAFERCTPSGGVTCAVPFGDTFGGAVRLLASVSSLLDDDTVDLRRFQLFADSVRLTLEEPLGPGGQTGGGDGLPHAPEDVSLVAVGGDGVLEAEGINRPPSVADDAVTVGPNGLSYLPLVIDPDPGDSFWVQDLDWVPGEGLPGNLSLDSDGRTVLYEPPAGGFDGSGQFTFRVRDRAQGGFVSGWAVVTLTYDSGIVVDARDDHYSFIPDLVVTAGESISFFGDLLLANDLPSEGLLVTSVAVIPGVTRGDVQITGQGGGGTGIRYDAPTDPAQAGDDVFLYTATHGSGSPSDTAQVTVNVLPGNRPPVANDDLVPVAFGVPEETIGDATLLANDDDPDEDLLEITDYDDLTVRGELTRQSGSFLYQPGPLFSYVGTDRFGYTASDPFGESDDALVTLQSDPPGPIAFEDFFDDGTLDAWSGTYVPSGGGLAVTPAAALAGSHGLAVTAVSGSTFVFASSKAPTAETDVGLFFQLDPNNLTMATGAEHTVASGVSGSGTTFSVRLGRSTTGYRMRAVAFEDDGSPAVTPWIDLGPKAAAVRTEWWSASGPGRDDGGLRLVIDEQATAEATGLDTDERVVETFRFGIAGGLDAGTVGTFHLDTVRLWRRPGALPVLLADPFEEGDLSLWAGTHIPNSGRLDVTGSAAIEGDGGLAVTLERGSTFVFAYSESLGGVGSLTAFFRLDPASLNLASETDHVIFSAVGPPGSGVTADLRLGYTTAGIVPAYRLRAFAFPDSGAAQATSWFQLPPLSPGPVTVRLEVTVAPEGGESGSLSLWVDGQLVGRITDLANGTRLIDRLRFGAAGGVDANTAGTYHLDDFRAWRAP